MGTCLLCGLEGAFLARLPEQEAYEIECKRCGKFVIEGILPRM